MKHYHDEWVQEWCQENGWTDLFIERPNSYWAFPPGGVIPEPIPIRDLKLIKAQKGMTFEEKMWSMSAFIGTVISGIISYLIKCPMPLVFGFTYCAIAVARLEVEV